MSLHEEAVRDDEPRFPVVECFTSVNGEGTHAGRLAAFVRFKGCNLACRYCDTVWANRPDAEAQMMTVSEIVTFVDESPAACVTLTGGEPLLQPGIDQIIKALLADPDRFVEIETNGAVSLTQFVDLRRGYGCDAVGRLAFTMDCKLPSSGMHDCMIWGNYDLLSLQDTVKFVIGDEDDLEAALHVIERYDLTWRCNVYFSPVFGEMDPARIVDFMQEHRLSQATLQLQLHKIIWPNVDRGV